jgi:N-methylhydantoinase B
MPGGAETPANAGCFRPVTFTLPEASVVNANPPRAVAAGNVETSQRIVDVVLGALARAVPELIPAASQGTMNNVAIGGWDTERGRQFAYYETIAGGAGASPSVDGLDAVHTHMTNTMNTPVEALEMAYPFRLLEYSVRRGTGGRGRMRGGDGVMRTYEFQAPASVTLLTERRTVQPWGLLGGEPGTKGRNRINGRGVPSKGLLRVAAGDRLIIETPGGGGCG